MCYGSGRIGQSLCNAELISLIWICHETFIIDAKTSPTLLRLSPEIGPSGMVCRIRSWNSNVIYLYMLQLRWKINHYGQWSTIVHNGQPWNFESSSSSIFQFGHRKRIWILHNAYLVFEFFIMRLPTIDSRKTNAFHQEDSAEDSAEKTAQRRQRRRHRRHWLAVVTNID